MADDCIEWPRARTKSGYGVKWSGAEKRVRYVHRTIFEQVHRVQLTRSDFICHTCDKPSCINVRHLFLGDNSANVADMVTKGRHARGFAKPNTRLTDDDVATIRRRRSSGDRVCDIARDFAVHQSHVSKIVAGTRRPDVEG